MKKIIKNVEDINFLSFTLLFFKLNKPLVLIMCTSIILPLPFFIKFEASLLSFQQFALFGSLLVSFMLHEYFHTLSFKIFNKKGPVCFESNFLRISIIPLFSLSNFQIMIMAILGPTLCFVIGLVLYVSATSQLMLFISYIFLLHILFLIPPFGDGKMIMKALLSPNLKGGE